MAGERVAVSLTEEEKTRFRTEAARRDLSMSELGQELLRDWLDEHAQNREESNEREVSGSVA